MKNEYLTLKLLIIELTQEVHEEKMAENPGQEPKRSSQRHLVWKSDAGLPYIPRKLHDDIIQELRPVGPARLFLIAVKPRFESLC